MRLLKFGAVWCSSCKMMTATINSIEDKPELLKNITEVDVDEDPELAMRFGIRGVPTLLVIDDSESEVKRVNGTLSRDKLLDFLKM